VFPTSHHIMISIGPPFTHRHSSADNMLRNISLRFLSGSSDKTGTTEQDDIPEGPCDVAGSSSATFNANLHKIANDTPAAAAAALPTVKRFPTFSNGSDYPSDFSNKKRQELELAFKLSTPASRAPSPPTVRVTAHLRRPLSFLKPWTSFVKLSMPSRAQARSVPCSTRTVATSKILSTSARPRNANFLGSWEWDGKSSRSTTRTRPCRARIHTTICNGVRSSSSSIL